MMMMSTSFAFDLVENSMRMMVDVDDIRVTFSKDLQCVARTQRTHHTDHFCTFSSSPKRRAAVAHNNSRFLLQKQKEEKLSILLIFIIFIFLLIYLFIFYCPQ